MLGMTSGMLGVTLGMLGVTSGMLGVTLGMLGVASGMLGVPSGMLGVPSGVAGVGAPLKSSRVGTAEMKLLAAEVAVTALMYCRVVPVATPETGELYVTGSL
jgi:hypothetical protein